MSLPGLQQREIEAQKDLVNKQVEDTTKLHVNSYVHKTQQRDLERKAEMDKYSNPHLKRLVSKTAQPKKTRIAV